MGKKTEAVESLDQNYIKDEEDFVRNADTLGKEREDIGMGSMYSEKQPQNRPKNDNIFVVTRIEALFMFDILDRDEPEKALTWCQGKVVKALMNKKSYCDGTLGSNRRVKFRGSENICCFTQKKI